MTADSRAKGHYLSALVEHLDAFTEKQREAIAKCFGAASNCSLAIAEAWCADQDGFLRTLDARIKHPDAWELLEELAYEHDMPVDISWIDKRVRAVLQELGLVKTKRGHKQGEFVMPGPMAALLAPELRGARPSLPIVLGKWPEQEVRQLADYYDIDPDLTKIEVIVALSERFSDPLIVHEIVARLPDSEWIGAAMMVLELGGICYWQEVFGYDLDENVGAATKVVPLMRPHERSEERNIAESLMEMGVLLRIEDEDAPFPLLAVPEELWPGMWSLGRSWLMEWVGNQFYEVAEQGLKRALDKSPGDLQSTLKWLLCEADKKHLCTVDGKPQRVTSAHLQEVGGHHESHWHACFDIALGLRILSENADGQVCAGHEYQKLLDLPRPSFVREVLLEWCTGFAVHRADRCLPTALGLDETWRQCVVSVLHQREEFVPLWMHYEGVASHSTGSGCLRNLEDSTDELLLLEMGFTNGFVWSIKLLWLDMLSVLESERWYSLESITELFQLTSCFALFTQLVHILEHPHFSFYLPLQRASFFTDPYHSTQFEAWVRDIIHNLFIPLGIATLSSEEEWIWLDTRLLRVESPPGWSDEQRIQVVRDVIGDDALEFRLPHANRQGLREVVPENNANDHFVSLEAPIEALRERLQGRKIARFDGKHVYFED